MVTREHPVIELFHRFTAPGGRPDWQSVEWAIGDVIGDLAWQSIEDPFLLIARAASALDAAGLVDGWKVTEQAAWRYGLCEYRHRRAAS